MITEEQVLARLVAVLAGKLGGEDPVGTFASYLLVYSPGDLLSDAPDVAALMARAVATKALEGVPDPQGVVDPPEASEPLEANLAFTDGLAGVGGFARELLTRATYAVNAFKRLTSKGKGNWTKALSKEGANYLAHRRAQKAREQKLGVIDDAIDRWGFLLSWRAVLDDTTTAECRAAHGANFDVNDPPDIGYPGLVHINCRCIPGPPVNGGRRI